MCRSNLKLIKYLIKISSGKKCRGYLARELKIMNSPLTIYTHQNEMAGAILPNHFLKTVIER
jgi:hypothetical protein